MVDSTRGKCKFFACHGYSKRYLRSTLAWLFFCLQSLPEKIVYNQFYLNFVPKPTSDCFVNIKQTLKKKLVFNSAFYIIFNFHLTTHQNLSYT